MRTLKQVCCIAAPVAFKDPMIRGSAIHIAYRILAAFFIDMGAKTSIVENLRFINLKIIYLIFFNVQNRRITSSKFSVGY